jgi:hypothetical protein
MSGHIAHAPHRSTPLTRCGWFFALVAGSILLLLGHADLPVRDIFPSTSNAPLRASYQPPAALSCIDPLPDAKLRCEAISRRILASTVRVMFFSDGPVRIGHGTVVGGRYVITHNHYATYQPDVVGQGLAGAPHISVALANGEFILRNAPISNFTIVVAEPGMLLIDFQTIDGTGFFDYHGIPSAPLTVWEPSAVKPGSEVAQVNWDGETTFVEWARVSSIRDADPVPALEIDNFIKLGASGGGVFYDGQHIANNCLQGMVYYTRAREMVRTHRRPDSFESASTMLVNSTPTRELVRTYSVAMLNTASALSLITSGMPAE